jgi:Flp pilus assembly protein TadG
MSTIIMPCRVKARGQSAVLIALALPFLVAFALLVVEVSERWLEVAMVEDALQQATRSAVQTFDYAALARGGDGMSASDSCVDITTGGAGACRAVIAVADRFLRTNLTGVRGLGEPIDDLADRVRWTVLPQGGTCQYSTGAARTETTPLICAEVRPQMRGLVGWGGFAPLITAADTLDTIR